MPISSASSRLAVSSDALALLVELAGRQLEQPRLAHRLAWLGDEVEPLAVVGHHSDGAGVADHLALDLLAVLRAPALHARLEDAALPDPIRGYALKAH